MNRTPSRSRMLLSLVLSAALTALTVATASPADARGGELAGTWTSVDLDGSHQTLRISGGGTPAYAMFLHDDFTSGGCGGLPANFVGSGTVDGNQLEMTGALICLPGGNPVRGRISIGFEYDATADTLTDVTGVVWERAD